MKYLSKLTSTTCNLEGVDGILTGNQNLYGAATGETWDYYVRVTDEGGFVDSLYAAANGIGDYGNSFLTGIVYAEGGFLTGGTVKAQNVLTQGIGAKGSFGLSVDNTNVITALSSGNVGIGTSSPVSNWLSGFDPSTGNSTFKLTSEGWIVTPYLAGLASYYPAQGARPIIWSDDNGTNIQSWDNSATDGISLRSSNGTTRLFVKEDGNVGIGTTSPSSPLDVLGKVSINTDGTLNWGNAKDYGRLTWDTGKAIVRGESGKALSLGANGTQDYLYINTSGNLGIGTTSPDSKLNIISGAKGIHIDKGGHSSTSANLSECRTNYAFAYDTLRNGSTTGFFITNVGTNVPAMQAVDSSNNAQNISIQPYGGNTGIGTTAPSYNLQVTGASTATIGIISNNEGKSYLRMHTNTNEGVYFEADDGSTNHLYIRNAGDNAYLMAIDRSNGNVGIGTTTPAQKLHVLGSARVTGDFELTGANPRIDFNFNSSDALRFYDSTNATERMRITSGGNVGIGTTVPGAKTHISGGGFDVYLDYSTTNSSIGISSLKKTSGKSALVVGRAHSTNNSAVMRFDYVGDNNAANYLGLGFYANDDLMVIKPSGNVGIGTTSPNLLLEIYSTGANNPATSGTTQSSGGRLRIGRTDGAILDVGTTGAAGLWLQTGNGTNLATTYPLLLNPNGGNVGIGTTSPSSKLQLGEDASTLGSNVFTMYRGGSTGQYTTIENQGGTVYKSHGVGGHAFYHDPAQEAMRVAATTGNLLVGTSTDAGYRLDVQGGDARFAQNVDAASYSVAGNPGWSGTVNFPTNLPGQQNLQFANGILVNVF